MAMALSATAAPQVRIASALSSLLPRLSMSPLLPAPSAAARSPWLRRLGLSTPFLPSLGLPAVSAAVGLNLPTLLGDVWETILRAAVPKKKTSHMKSRHRQMAGKALKDEKAFCACPACGEIKRQHVLCENCMKKMHGMFRRGTTIGGKEEQPPA